MYLLGYDIGSSSIKAGLVDSSTGERVGLASSPDQEMSIQAPRPGWAEQDPELWWYHMKQATARLLEGTGINAGEIRSVGISYQMHGLVLIDETFQVLRPSIIWCDSRATPYGTQASDELGLDYCFDHLLNTPGNFTASKLKWVKEHEPDLYRRIHKLMLPGDFIAYRLTGECSTTISALSEGILWDFKEHQIARRLLETMGIKENLVPDLAPIVGLQGRITSEAAAYLGIPAGIPLGYRAGDQPNNAMSLNVLHPGEVAATGGTSGVVYCITDRYEGDRLSRVNHFAHVNHTQEDPRIGVLLCINGAGIQYSWINQHVAPEGTRYIDMEKSIDRIPIGSDGLKILPFGNGAERMLGNRHPGSQIRNLHFNRHSRDHMYRAALEGIAFSFVYGMESMKDLGIEIQSLKVGNDNLFQSPVFSNTIATLTKATINIIETTGAIGAAKASGVALGVYQDLDQAMRDTEVLDVIQPDIQNEAAYEDAYLSWKDELHNLLHNQPN